MKNLGLQPGDIFCEQGSNFIAKSINFFQALWAKDKKSKYSHCGIIIDSNGKTLEALNKVKHKNLYTTYKKSPILVARHHLMTETLFNHAYKQIEKHKNDRYPYYRLIFHMIPAIAKRMNPSKLLVCSELVAKFLCFAGLKRQYLGVNVDNIADNIKKNKGCWQIVYEGKLTDSK